ncbi:MAG: universal stress protein [Chthoniobacteraceae bacterium]
MKTIVIAYDGSECSEAIFTELQQAGLPPHLDADVVAVAELWSLTPATLAATPVAQTQEAAAMRRAGGLAAQGAARARTIFPAWVVVETRLDGSVARGIVQRARDVDADIIFIGSQSRSTVVRFFLGSVSQKVAAEAKCSVRICRPRPRSGGALRLLVAVDGSRASQSAVRAVAERAWPAGTAVAVVNVIEPSLRAGDNLTPEDASEIQRQHEARLDWLESVGAAAQHELESAGLGVERHSLDGEPKSTLLEWAERWNADCLFIGATGLHHPGSDSLGTVASALAVRAHCTVEIVRP